MSQAILSVNMDANIKARFDTFCEDAGMNSEIAVNMFAKAVLREKRIPFEITGNDDPFYSEYNQKRLREAIDQLEAGGGTVHELIEVDDE
jgi:DNA-damage-inducible protein J